MVCDEICMNRFGTMDLMRIQCHQPGDMKKAPSFTHCISRNRPSLLSRLNQHGEKKELEQIRLDQVLEIEMDEKLDGLEPAMDGAALGHDLQVRLKNAREAMWRRR